MAGHEVMVLSQGNASDLAKSIVDYFSADFERDIHQIPNRLSNKEYKVVVLDCVSLVSPDMEMVSMLIQMDETQHLPIVMLANASSLQAKLDALEIGCDDYIEAGSSVDDACTRITKSIYHRVAANQLANRLDVANRTAQTAMVGSSDLGANIQFLLSTHDCDNLDQLGQLFFSAIERYGVKCSLQMRSCFELKNMEAHGMAKDLESQMLSQLKDGDRYIDFGARTIVNYDRVSLLIKNMPVNNAEKYGAVKDNTFSLVQGLNARIASLEDREHILQEQIALKKLSSDVRDVMSSIQSSYQHVMRNIATEVDHANDLVQKRIPLLAITETDERYLEKTMEDCVNNTARIFNEGLKVDHVMQTLDATISKMIDASTYNSQDNNKKIRRDNDGKPIELF